MSQGSCHRIPHVTHVLCAALRATAGRELMTEECPAILGRNIERTFFWLNKARPFWRRNTLILIKSNLLSDIQGRYVSNRLLELSSAYTRRLNSARAP